ncbi:hypothetical protein [Paraburkholderia diazotrophica]|uniref:hypothetical protein n=1 Tax=Paraburkholderia diazotrophica TaxID=667676 RepID=UPI00316D748C
MGGPATGRTPVDTTLVARAFAARATNSRSALPVDKRDRFRPLPDKKRKCTCQIPLPAFPSHPAIVPARPRICILLGIVLVGSYYAWLNPEPLNVSANAMTALLLLLIVGVAIFFNVPLKKKRKGADSLAPRPAHKWMHRKRSKPGGAVARQVTAPEMFSRAASPVGSSSPAKQPVGAHRAHRAGHLKSAAFEKAKINHASGRTSGEVRDNHNSLSRVSGARSARRGRNATTAQKMDETA